MSSCSNSLISIIKADLAYYYYESTNTPKQTLGVVWFLRACIDIDFRVLLYWRISSKLCVRKFTKYLGILIYYRNKSRYGVDLSPWAIVDPGIRLMHAFGIVVGPNVRIYRGTKIFHQVTLGKSRPDKEALMMPSIGRYCILGGGAKILGDVNIPDGSLVPANSVLTGRKLSRNQNLILSVSPSWQSHMENIFKRSQPNSDPER